MRKSRFTEEQIIAIVQESAAGAKAGELIRRHGISHETFLEVAKAARHAIRRTGSSVKRWGDELDLELEPLLDGPEELRPVRLADLKALCARAGLTSKGRFRRLARPHLRRR
jgi:Transposase